MNETYIDITEKCYIKLILKDKKNELERKLIDIYNNPKIYCQPITYSKTIGNQIKIINNILKKL